jgi:hypothetical protein
MIPRCGASESGRRHQLVTPQSVYFNYSVLKNDMGGNLNAFFPQVGPTWERFLTAAAAWDTLLCCWRPFIAQLSGN